MKSIHTLLPFRPITPDPWQSLRRYTQARIALGRSGSSLPTAAWLGFGLSHAQARDAVHQPLDAATLHGEIEALGSEHLHVTSRASMRDIYLKRPDLGRQLAPESAAMLAEVRSEAPPDVVFVVADGLSSLAVARHAVPLLRATMPLLQAWKIGPIVVAEQGRVALGDPVAVALEARAVVVLIGERPGLTSADSLGVYLTYAPRPGMTDADRNCISNVRPEGLAYAEAARKIAYLLAGARRLGQSGVALKDDSDADTKLDAPSSFIPSITTTASRGESA